MKRDDKGNPLKKDTPHTRYYHWMTQCPAWKDLNSNARCIYLLIKEKYNGRNNGKLALSIREAASDLGIGKTTVQNALHELNAHGFIEVVIQGSFAGRKDGKASEYRLDELPCDLTKDLPAKRFMRWRPGEDFHSPTSGTVSTSGRTVSTSGRTVRSA